MELSKNDVLHVAELVRIELKADEGEKFVGELSKILNHIDELKLAKIDNIETIEQISNLENITRKDDVVKGLPIAKILQNLPESQGNFIKVKKIFE